MDGDGTTTEEISEGEPPPPVERALKGVASFFFFSSPISVASSGFVPVGRGERYS